MFVYKKVLNWLFLVYMYLLRLQVIIVVLYFIYNYCHLKVFDWLCYIYIEHNNYIIIILIVLLVLIIQYVI